MGLAMSRPVSSAAKGTTIPQNDAVSKALASAKSTLSHATAAFPGSVSAPAKSAAPATPAKAAPSLGDELAAKKTMVDKAVSALPKMHDGGPVVADGAYQLKAGEHVLTAAEVIKARKHAIMASGIKSLVRPGRLQKRFSNAK